MEENRQDRDIDQAQQNTEPGRKRTRHTWIGDKEEVRPDVSVRPVSRMTIPDSNVRSTKTVERQKRPYKGFITDEEVKYAEAAAEVDRRARAESAAARQGMKQTRVYSGFGSGLDSEEGADSANKKSGSRQHRSVNLRIADSRKFKRLIALAAVLVLLLAFEISFAVMKAGISSLPSKTSALKAETEEINAENAKLENEADKIGDYDQIKDNRDSWQRIKDRLAE